MEDREIEAGHMLAPGHLSRHSGHSGHSGNSGHSGHSHHSQHSTQKQCSREC